MRRQLHVIKMVANRSPNDVVYKSIERSAHLALGGLIITINIVSVVLLCRFSHLWCRVYKLVSCMIGFYIWPMENCKEWCIISRLFEQVLGGLRKLGKMISKNWHGYEVTISQMWSWTANPKTINSWYFYLLEIWTKVMTDWKYCREKLMNLIVIHHHIRFHINIQCGLILSFCLWT